MNSWKKIVLSVSLILLAFGAFSQEIEGTYYYEVLGRGKPSIPADINELVMQNRKDHEEVVLSLGTHLRVRILSKDTIEAPGFTPVANQYVNVPSFD